MSNLACEEDLRAEEQRSDIALAEYLEQCSLLASEIQDLPQVRSVKCTSSGSDAQKNRAIAQLGCHNGAKLCRVVDQKFNTMKCTEHEERSQDCKTCQSECHDHLDALMLLKRKIADKHSSIECTASVQAAERPSHESKQEDIRRIIANAKDAFSHMGAGQRLKVRTAAAEKALKAAGKHENEANQKLHIAKEEQQRAVAAREAAAKELAEAKALAESLAGKRQRKQPSTSQAASPSLQDEQDCETAEEQALEAADPEAWESYQLPMFKGLSRKYARTSKMPIDPTNLDKMPPARGDDDGKRGWRHHSQYGMYGATRHWANGSPFRVAFMLAELAKYFDVVDAVAEQLGLSLSKEAVEQVPTCY